MVVAAAAVVVVGVVVVVVVVVVAVVVVVCAVCVVLTTSHLAPHLLHVAHALYCVCSVFVSFALQDGVLILMLIEVCLFGFLIEVGHEARAVSGAPAPE